MDFFETGYQTNNVNRKFCCFFQKKIMVPLLNKLTYTYIIINTKQQLSPLNQS